MFEAIDEIFAHEGNEVLKVLMRSAREGHLCLHRDEVDPDLHFQFDQLSSPFIHKEGNDLYLLRNWTFEGRVAEALAKLFTRCSREQAVDIDLSTYNQEQQAAIRKWGNQSFTLLIGGPGTGKTYTAAGIASAFAKANPEGKITLAAPTGKAVGQLKESVSKFVKCEAMTLHALLKISRSAQFNEAHTPYIDTDFLLVDECSMIDARLFAKLLEAIAPHTDLVLMGDSEQLPPVESGSLFTDIIESSAERVTRLKQCMRSDRKALIHFAAAINTGILMPSGEGIKQVDYAFELSDQISFYQELASQFFLTSHCDNYDSDKLEEQFKSFRILSSLRKGPFGVEAINTWLAEHFKCKGNRTWFVMPIMITRTSATLELSNGDMGLLFSHASDSKLDHAVIAGKKILKGALSSYEPAYCLSVHKSQGSEYDRVALLIPPGSERFGREILYTGVTRAREQCVVYGKQEHLEQLVQAVSRKRSNLQKRISLLQKQV